MIIRSIVRILSCVLFATPLIAETPSVKLEQFGNTPLVFEPNYGQADSSVRFISRGNRFGLFLTESEAVVSLVGDKSALVRMQLVGQSPHPQISGSDIQPGESHYFKGSNSQKWQQAVPQFLKVEYRGVYPGIDLTYYGNQSQLEYDFTVSPHSNPNAIALKFSGTTKIEIGENGDLILHTSAGEIRHQHPHIFQNRNGDEETIDGKFVLLGGEKVGFRIGDYDTALPLVIDPKFIYSSYFGGAGPNGDVGIDVKVDASGNAYVTGYTSSTDFFTTNLSPTAPGGGNLDAFLLKVNPTGSAVLSAVYYGGSADDEGHRIALDASGNIYITGYTTSSDFPIVNGFQTKLGGRRDAYLIKMDNSASQILFSSYLGGSKDEEPSGLSIDGSGNIVIAGYTFSDNFPVVNPNRLKFAGGLGDAFVAKISPNGTVVYATYLGGRGNDRAYDVTTDAAGNAYIVGFTSSPDFPVLNALYNRYQGGSEDAFMTKLSPDGSQILISTYFGGSSTEEAIRVALDSAGNIIVAGLTSSTNIPVKNAIQTSLAGGSDIFLVKFFADDTDIFFSTYIGSDGTESPPGLALDSLDDIFLAGFTTSFSFPVVNGIDIGTSGGGLKGSRDAYVMKLGPNATILFSTYIGGSDTDGAIGIALDAAGNAYVTGNTFSTDFPTLNPFQATPGGPPGAADGFLLKIDSSDVAVTTALAIPTNGATSVSTVGNSNNIAFIHATFDAAGGAPAPAGFALLDLRQAGVEIGEAAFPLLPFIHEGVVFVNETSTESTNLAIVNPSDDPVPMYFFLSDNQNNTSNYGMVTIPPKSSFAEPVTSNPINLPAGSTGTFRFSTTIPVAALAFRTFTETSGSILLTNLPIAKPTEFETRTKVIAHFASDADWTSQFILVNPTDFQMTGQIQFFGNGIGTGDPTQSSTPLTVTTDRGVFSSTTYNLAPGAMDFFSTTGASDALSGFALIIPDAGTYTPAASVLLARSTGGVNTMHATEEAAVPTTDLRLFEDLSGDVDNAEGHSFGMAFGISNPNPTPATITMKVVNMDGTLQGLSSTFTLPPMGHIATFLHQMADFSTLPNPFQGTVLVHASDPGIVAMSLRAGWSETGNVVGTATGPLKEHPGQGSTAIFPHILDGGGYATRFFLFNDPTGPGLAGTLRFANENGADIPLTIDQSN